MVKTVHLGAHFPSENNPSAIWTEPFSEGMLVDFAQDAERALLDFFFIPEVLDSKRPDTFRVLKALVDFTTCIGLVGTVNATFSDPTEVTKQFAALGDRTGWNVVTSRDSVLPSKERYENARCFVRDVLKGCNPVIFQAGDSDNGREFAISMADVIISRHSGLIAGQDFYTDITTRAERRGYVRPLIMPMATYVLGDSNADANECARVLRQAQVTEEVAVRMLRKAPSYVQQEFRAQQATAQDFIISRVAPQTFIGTPLEVAQAINQGVQENASDGYILAPSTMPKGLDDFIEKVVPLLREDGVFRTSYEGDFRSILGLRGGEDTEVTVN